MIKKLKNGFSLAELLIVMAIIAIVTAMSFTIAKKGIKSAYNLFFYNGYNSMFEAIGDAIDNDYEITSTVAAGDFAKHIIKIMSGTVTASTGTSVEFSVPNGITYKISYAGTYTANTEPGEIYKIVMKVPHQKTSSSTDAAVTMYYLPDYNNGTFLPSGTLNNENTVNLQERTDLLPFYIDDGTVGRSIEYETGYKYEKATYYNFKTAYCKANGPISLGGVSYVNCTGISGTGASKGLLKTISPRNVF